MDGTEMVIIVDKDDNVIEFRDRQQVGTYDLHRIAAVWIINGNGEALIAQRAHTMSNQPGVWGPAAAGTVSMGEDYLETAQRELAEEIGLSGVQLTQTGKFMTDKDFGECRMCAVFTGLYDGDIATLMLQPEEVAEVRWVTMTQLQTELDANPQNFVINMRQVISRL